LAAGEEKSQQGRFSYIHMLDGPEGDVRIMPLLCKCRAV